MLRLRAKRRLARIQTDEGGDGLRLMRASSASGPQKISSRTAQRCLDGTPTTKMVFSASYCSRHDQQS